MTCSANPLPNSPLTTVGLHEAKTPRELAPALFKFMREALPQQVLFLVLRPLEFELPSFCSRPDFQKICDNYIAGDHRNDIWLKRSPVNPETPVVRHSLYTPQALFRRSRFYREVMEKIGCEYGASLVAWRDATWLGNLTIFRTKEQGDFREDELPALKACHVHFQSAIKRVAELHEERLGSNSLETFIWSLPTAILVLDWNMKLLHSNASGQDLVADWEKGRRMAAVKPSRRFPIPSEISNAIERKKKSLGAIRPNTPGSPRRIPFLKLQHPRLAELSAEVFFLPSKSLAISKGTFLVVLHRQEVMPDERNTYDRMAELTRRERDVVLLAVAGKNSAEIAKKLGTSPITVRMQLHKAYKKLGIHSRFELMAQFSQNLPIRKSQI
jgi:DNA-binding CsgD family transcriptional regulator